MIPALTCYMFPPTDLAPSTILSESVCSDFPPSPITSHVSHAQIKPSHYSRAFLINNAGSLGDLSKLAHEYTDVKELTAFMTLNFTTMVALTYAFSPLWRPWRLL